MLPNTTGNSGTDKNLSDPAKDLIKEICIVFANNTSFVARLISIRDENESWFESKSGQRWMVARMGDNEHQAIASRTRRAL